MDIKKPGYKMDKIIKIMGLHPIYTYIEAEKLVDKEISILNKVF